MILKWINVFDNIDKGFELEYHSDDSDSEIDENFDFVNLENRMKIYQIKVHYHQKVVIVIK